MAQRKESGRRLGKTVHAVRRATGADEMGVGRMGQQMQLPARVEQLEARQLLAGSGDSLGTEFWVAFEPNLPADTAAKSLFLSSMADAQVTVEIPGMSWTQNYLVQPGQVVTVDLPLSAYATSSDGISNVGIHVTSDQEIALYGMNQVSSSSEGFTGIPVDMLGTSYIVLAYSPNSTRGSELAVVATQDGTNVQITPKVNAGARLAGIPYVVTLNRGEVYQLQAQSFGPQGDLTGSQITSDRPIAVFSGNPVTHVPFPGYGSLDHLVEQLLPTNAWGDHFLTVPLAGRVKGDVFRVLARQDGTDVNVNGTVIATLSAGQYYEWLGAVAQEISTSKPVTLAQYATCVTFDGTDGDPFMVIIQPADQSLTHYTMNALAGAFDAHYINFWTTAGTTVLLDGAAIPASAFTPIGASGYVRASRSVTAGTHTVSASAPVGIMLYGWGANADSYGWVGGYGSSAHAPVAADQSITVQHNTPYAGAVVATDPDGDALTYSPVTQPVHGTLSLQADGTFTYTPASDYYGLDSFTFKANDGTLDSNIATVSITVTPDALTNLLLSPASIPENQPIGTAVGGFSVTGPDATAPFTYVLVSGTGATDNGSFTITGSQLLSAAIFDYETKSSYTIRVGVTDSVGRHFEQPLTVTITNINEAPTDLTLSAMTVAENQPVGTAVGTFGTTDPDIGDTFTYSLVSGTGSTDNASFTISGNTLQTAQIFDFETRNSYSIRVRSTDAGGLLIEKAFTITVTNVNEAPTDIALSNSSVVENQLVDTTVGTLSTTDSDTGSTFTYTLVAGTGSTDNASFTISGNILKTAASFDFETRNSYGIRIRSTDQTGLSFEKAFTISITDLDEAPTNITLSASTIPENRPVGTTIGSFSSTALSGDTFTYSLVSGAGSSDNANFNISGNRLLSAASFDFEASSSYTIRVRSTAQGGLWYEKAFTITVSDVNEAPTDLALSGSSIAENQPSGTTLGTLSTTDPDANNTFTYTLVAGTGGSDNSSFTISGNKLLTAASFNYEIQNNYSIRIRSTDAGGLSFEKALTVNITNVNEALTGLTLSNNSIPEAQPSGTAVGTFTTTDPDAGSTFTYTLVSGVGSADNGLFAITDSTLTTAAVFNYEARNSYSIRVRSTDQGGMWYEKLLVITVTNVNEAPSDVALNPSSVEENQEPGTIVGTLSSSDQDAGDAFTYSLVAGAGDDDNARFSIIPGQPAVLTTASLDYENQNTYSIRVRSTDSGGLWFEKVLTIRATNENEAPTDLDLDNASVEENQPAGTLVGTLFTSDPDSDDAFTYSLVDGDGSDDNASFTIAGSDLLTADSFDFEDEHTDTYRIRIRSTDTGGLEVEKALTITVTDANEAPTQIMLNNASVLENQPSGTVVGTLFTSDPDNTTGFTYTLVDGPDSQDNSRFVLSGNELLTAATFDHESQDSYSIRILSSDPDGLSVEQTFVIDIRDVNEAPTDLALSNTTLQENLPAGTVVGSFLPSDPDAGETFTYSLVDAPGGDDNACFTIEGEELLTAKRFNYEFWRSYSVRVRATDSGGLSTEQVLPIDISDDPTDYRGVFGRTGGRKPIKLTLADADGDRVIFTLKGTGTGQVYGFENSFEDLFLTGTGPKTVMTVKVKKFRMKGQPSGDGLITLGNITSDGPIRSINAPAAILSGLTQLNTEDQPIGKTKLSLKLRQISTSDLRLQNLPVSTIAVKRDITDTRIQTSSSIKSLKAATLLDSEILVGVATDFTGAFATSAEDFTNPTARLGSLKIFGRKLHANSPHPADVSNSHISAPTVGTIALKNVPADSAPILHVANDAGTLKLTRSKLTIVPMLAPGTWNTPSTHPAIWEVLPPSAG